jgi:hypothetical protein
MWQRRKKDMEKKEEKDMKKKTLNLCVSRKL